MTAQPQTEILGQQINPPPQAEPDDPLSALVGPGKKYADVAALARGYIHADLKINELKTANSDQTRKESVLEELIDELKSNRTKVAEVTSGDNGVPPANVPPPPAKPNAEDVRQTVDHILQEREALRVAKENETKAIKLLTDEYGDVKSGMEAVAKVCANDKDIIDVVNRLGRTSPDKLLAFVKANLKEEDRPVKSNTPGVDNAITSEQAQISVTGELTWAKAREIKKKNPKLYHSQAFRNQLEAAVVRAKASGKDFFN